MDNQDLINRLKTPIFKTLTEKCDFLKECSGWFLLREYYDYTNYWVNEYAHSECQKYAKESTVQKHLCSALKHHFSTEGLSDYDLEILFNPRYLDLDTVNIIHEMKEFIKNS